jgi:hypothetical protein
MSKYKQIEAVCTSQISDLCRKSHFICESSYKNNIKINKTYKCRACCAIINNSGSKNSFYKNLQVNEHFFDIIDSDLKAYMLGIIAGDGSLTRNTLHVVAHPIDMETLKLFQTYVSPFSNILKLKHYNCSYISIPSKYLSKTICNHLKITFGKKSDKIVLPDLMSKDLIFAFIRGLMDSDGSIRNIITDKTAFPSCTYASMSNIIKDQIKKILDIEGINHTEDKIQIRINGINAIKFMDLIYKNATVYLIRKHALYLISKCWTPQKGSPFRPRKIRKDKGTIKGPKIISEQARQNIIASNKKRAKNK